VGDGRDQLAAHPLRVVHHAAAHQLDGAHGDDDRERRDDGDHERVVRRDEHQRDAGPDRHDELAHRDRDPHGELAARRAEPPAARAGHVGENQRRRAEHDQQRERHRPVAQAVDGGDRAGGQQRGTEAEQRGARRAHGWNR
jgi:hypothetical protein